MDLGTRAVLLKSLSRQQVVEHHFSYCVNLLDVGETLWFLDFRGKKGRGEIEHEHLVKVKKVK